MARMKVGTTCLKAYEKDFDFVDHIVKIFDDTPWAETVRKRYEIEPFEIEEFEYVTDLIHAYFDKVGVEHLLDFAASHIAVIYKKFILPSKLTNDKKEELYDLVNLFVQYQISQYRGHDA